MTATGIRVWGVSVLAVIAGSLSSCNYLHGGEDPGTGGCIDAGGGLGGSYMTMRLLNDLRNDPDNKVPLVVF